MKKRKLKNERKLYGWLKFWKNRWVEIYDWMFVNGYLRGV